VLRIKLRFQKYISITLVNDITVFNQPEIKAAVTKQIVAVQQSQPSIIELVTESQWPFKLNAELGTFSLSLSPPGAIQRVEYGVTDCDNAQGNFCKQVWQTKLSLNKGTCTLDGKYALSWKRECSPGLTSECPLQAGDINTTVTYSLASENFCATITVDIGLFGNISIFEDVKYKISQTSFYIGSRAYFLLKVDSDLNHGGKENIIISSCDLVTISLTPIGGTVPIVLFANGAVEIYGNSTGLNDTGADLMIDNSQGAKAVGFSFVFSEYLASQLCANGDLTFTVSAEASVSYSGSKKRWINDVEEIEASSGNDNSEFSVKASFASLGTNSFGNGGSTGGVNPSNGGTNGGSNGGTNGGSNPQGTGSGAGKGSSGDASSMFVALGLLVIALFIS